MTTPLPCPCLNAAWPKGAVRSWVVIVLTPPETADRPPARHAVPDLEEYQRMLALARRQAPPSPWLTTAETMNALREGEES